MARNIIKSIHWVDAGYGRYCASMAEADAYIGGQTA